MTSDPFYSCLQNTFFSIWPGLTIHAYATTMILYQLYITNLNLFAMSFNISLYKENEEQLVLTIIRKGKTHKSTLSKFESVTSKLVNCERKLVPWLKSEHAGFLNLPVLFFLITTGFLQYVKNCTLKFSYDLLIP